MNYTVRFLRRLIARHRRTVGLHVLRGLSFGTGTTAVSLFVVWFQHHS